MNINLTIEKELIEKYGLLSAILYKELKKQLLAHGVQKEKFGNIWVSSEFFGRKNFPFFRNYDYVQGLSNLIRKDVVLVMHIGPDSNKYYTCN